MNQEKMLTDREIFQQKYNSARGNLIFMIALTTINILMLGFNADVMFLFSATIPYISVTVGMFSDFLLPGVAFAVVLLTAYFLCWVFSKKHYGWMIVALVLFIIDTLAMAGLYLLAEDFSGIFDAIIHIWVLYYLVIGVKYGSKLIKMPEDTQENILVQQQPIPSETTVQNSTFEYFPTPLRRADTEVKARVLLEEEAFGHHIVYRRVKRINELVIDGYVYDDVEMLIESAHSLTTKLDGHTIQVGFDGGVHSYLRIDGNTIKNKLRFY